MTETLTENSGTVGATPPLYLLEDVDRDFQRGGTLVQALRGVSLEIRPGELLAVEGPSGSGKSTLLQLLGAMDTPTSGRVDFDGRALAHASDKELTGLRRDAIGFVFQQFNLIPTLTAVENVEIAMTAQSRTRAMQLLTHVGLEDRAEHLPSRLSGGEQQRVAIARALANDPRVVLADEPTGNLDATTAQEVVDLLVSLNAKQGVTVVVVTHDEDVAARMRRRVRLRSGAVVTDSAATSSASVPGDAAFESLAHALLEPADDSDAGADEEQPEEGTAPVHP